MENISYITLIIGGVSSFVYYCGLTFSEDFIVDANGKTMTFQLLSLPVALFAWWILGWGISFGDDTNYFAGRKEFAHITADQYAMFFFTFTLACASTTIMMKLLSKFYRFEYLVVLSFFFSAFTISVMMHWLWSDQGWASPYRSTVRTYLLCGCGVADSAGASIIHLAAGIVYLCFLLMNNYDTFNIYLIPSKNFSVTIKSDKNAEFRGNTTVFRYMSCMITIAGFCGVNSMTNLPIINSVEMAGKRAIMTLIATASCAVVSTLMNRYLELNNPLNVFDSITGSLVAISAGCSSCEFEGAFVIGVVSSFLHYAVTYILNKSIFQATSSILSNHVISPIWGLCAVGFLASKEGYTWSYADEFIDGTSRASICAGVFYGGRGNQLAANFAFIFAVVAWSLITMAPLLFLGKLYAAKKVKGSPKPLDKMQLDSQKAPAASKSDRPRNNAFSVAVVPSLPPDMVEVEKDVVFKSLHAFNPSKSSISFPNPGARHSHDNMNDDIEAQKSSFNKKEEGYSWDVCLVMSFRSKVDDNIQEKEQVDRVPQKLIQALDNAKFETFLYYSQQHDEIICLLRYPSIELLSKADQFEYVLPLDSKKIEETARRGNENFKGFSILPGIKEGFTTMLPYDHMYAQYLQKKRYLFKNGPDLNHPFTALHRLRLMKKIVDDICHSTYHTDSSGLYPLIMAFYPLHNEKEANELEKHWLSWTFMPWNTPVDAIKDYFGERIGLYFSFISHYTIWLFISAGLGLCVTLHLLINLDLFDDIKGAISHMYSVPVYCFCIAIWTQAMLENWKQKQTIQSLKWGTTQYEENEAMRRDFEGTDSVSIYDGSVAKIFSNHDRLRRYRTTMVAIACKIVFVVGCFSAVFYFKYYTVHISQNPLVNLYGPTIADVINAIQIAGMSKIYQSISKLLTAYENNRTDTEYEDSLVSKLFYFEFVNSYLPAFYIAFVKDAIGDECFAGSCFLELAKLMLTLFISKPIINYIVSSTSTRVNRYLRAKKEGSVEGKEPSPAEKEYILDPNDDLNRLIEDYNELSIQFGFMTLFIAACPFIPAIALVLNILEIKNDGSKMLRNLRRPFPVGAEDIGAWYNIFENISIIAVFTNCGIVFYTMDIMKPLDDFTQLWLAFVFIAVSFSGRALVAYFVADFPTEVAIQLRRQEHIIDKLLKDVPDDTVDHRPNDPNQPEFKIASSYDDAKKRWREQEDEEEDDKSKKV